VTSNTITVSGINAAAPISIAGGTYSVNGGAYTSAAGTVTNGATVSVRATSSSSNSTTVNATLTIGGVSDTFSVTTLADPIPSSGWSKSFGDAVHDRGYAVATDSEGNIIMAGSFTGTVDFGGGPLVSNNNSYSDLFIAKFSPTGAHLWSRSVGGFYDDAVYGVAVDANNNVLVTGTFSGTADFGGGPLTSAGGPDIFVAKYSSLGAYFWAERFGNTLSDGGYAIAVDGSGNVLVTGCFQNSIDFGGGSLLAYDASPDAFVVKLSSSGAHLWSKAFGGAYGDYGQGIAVDGSGNVLVTGRFQGSVDFGAGQIFSKGGYDIVIAKYSPSGAYLWSKCLGDTSHDIGYGVAVDVNGDIVVTGRFQGRVDFGGGPLASTSATGPDVFVAKYSATGGNLWSMTLGAAYGISQNLALDGNGDIVVSGYFLGNANFGGGLLSSVGGSMDIFVAKYSANADHLWSRRFGDTSSDVGRSVAVDVNGNVIVTGSFTYTVDFGYGPMTANAYDQIFIVKLNP